MRRQKTLGRCVAPQLIVGVAMLALVAARDSVAGDCAIDGCWDSEVALQISPAHAILLHNGRVQCFQRTEGPSSVALINVPTTTIQYLADGPRSPDGDRYDAFCAGHATLADGRVLIRGGNATTFDYGRYTSFYTPDSAGGTGTWSAGPLEVWEGLGGPVNTARYYPTLTTLANGKVLSLDGNVGDRFLNQQVCPDPNSGNANIPALYEALSTPGSPGQWALLNDLEYFPQYGAPGSECPAPEGNPNAFALAWYPFVFQLQDGSILYAGFSDQPDCSDATCSQTGQRDALYVSRLIDPTRTMWQTVGSSPIVGQTAVFYQKRVNDEVRSFIMKAGGNSQGTQAGIPEFGGDDRVFTMDVTSTSNLQWVQDDSLPETRLDFYLVALPDGSILAVGGTTQPPMFDPNDAYLGFHPALRPARYDPYQSAGQRWTSLDAPVTTPRVHHAVAVLLPDGSVFSAGGDYPGFGSLKKYQVYRPPYFFQGTRPAITSIPASAIYGTWFNVDVSVTASSVTAVRLIRPGAATHSFDQNQRMLELEFTVLDSDTIRVKAPQNGNVAPPGYYMLFVATGTNGTLPSDGKFIKIRSYLTPL